MRVDVLRQNIVPTPAATGASAPAVRGVDGQEEDVAPIPTAARASAPPVGG